MKKPGKQYAIQCATNNIQLGLPRCYFIDWATACGYTKATAATYWKIAKKILNSQSSILNSI